MLSRTKSLIFSPQLWRAALWVWWLSMFLGTHIPPRIPHLAGGVLDKFVHMGAFAGLSFLFALNWQLFGGHLTLRHYLATVLVLASYAAFDEISQTIVHRDSSLVDWAADVAGAVIGVTVFHVGRKYWQQR